MKEPGLPADQQFFADLFSGLVLNPQRLGHVWFATQPATLPTGSLCIDLPRLDIVLRGEYSNLLQKQQHNLAEGDMLFIPAKAANLPGGDKPVMLLSLVFLRHGWDSLFTIIEPHRCFVRYAVLSYPIHSAAKARRCSPH